MASRRPGPDLLDQGAPLVAVSGEAAAAPGGIHAGGYAALAAIEAAGYDVLARHPKPDKRRLASKAAATLRERKVSARVAGSPLASAQVMAAYRTARR